ncbi:hypothetical protein ACRU43_16380 [Mycobacterium colombiense]
MYRRWKSTYTLKWTPIITFTRRYLSLLEWFEKNVDPVAFNDGPHTVGVALIANDLRVTVNRSAMTLESGLSGLEIEKLIPAVAGILDIMEPKDIVLQRSRSMSTVELPGVDYSEARAQFGASCSAPPVIRGGFRPIDGSALADLDSESVRMQVEWGIVKRRELLMRLRTPLMSRIDDNQDSARKISAAEAHALIGDQAPEVSVLVEASARRKIGGEVHDAESACEAVANMDALGRGVSESLAAEFVKRMGEANELRTGA